MRELCDHGREFYSSCKECELNAETELTTLRARIAELEQWKAESLLRWEQAVSLGGQQLERIAELEALVTEHRLFVKPTT